MKKVKTISSLTILFILALTNCDEADYRTVSVECSLQTDMSHPYAARYQGIIDEFIDAGVPGVSLTVISPEGTWTAAAGKADLANDIDMNACNTLRIGSASKVITAAAIMKLHQDSIIDIDEKLNKYIPRNITDEIDNANKVTIRQLLNHTSGIREHLTIVSYLEILNLTETEESAEERLESIYDKSADFSPGEDLSYSNTNTVLLALVLKHMTQYSSGYAAAQQLVLAPLGLLDTYAGTERPQSLSRGYYDTFDNGLMKDLTDIDHYACGGPDRMDGGFISTSLDIARFLDALFNEELLNSETLDLMQTFYTFTADMHNDSISRMGLGLMEIEIENGRGIGHYGGIYCFTSANFHFPEQAVTMSVILNGNSAKINEIRIGTDIMDALFED